MAAKGVKEKARIRRLESYRLRTIEGLSYREIGKQLSISYMQASRDIMRAINEMSEERIEQIQVERTRENAKLDVVERTLFSEMETIILIKSKVGDENIEVEETNKPVIDTWLRLAKRRSELNGYDKPQKIAPTTPDGEQEYGSKNIIELRREVMEGMDKLFAEANARKNGKAVKQTS